MQEEQTSTLTVYKKKYLLRFMDKTEEIVSEDQMKIIDELWARKDGSTFVVNGRKILANQLVSIKPYQDNNFQNKSDDTQKKLVGYIKSAKNVRQEKMNFWINHLKENFKKLKKGEKWQFADMAGNPITKEEADKLYQGNQQKEFTQRTKLGTEWNDKYKSWNVIKPQEIF